MCAAASVEFQSWWDSLYGCSGTILYPGVLQAQHCDHAREGGESGGSALHCEAYPPATGVGLGATVQKGHTTLSVCPKKGHKDGGGSGRQGA